MCGAARLQVRSSGYNFLSGLIRNVMGIYWKTGSGPDLAAGAQTYSPLWQEETWDSPTLFWGSAWIKRVFFMNDDVLDIKHPSRYWKRPKQHSGRDVSKWCTMAIGLEYGDIYAVPSQEKQNKTVFPVLTLIFYPFLRCQLQHYLCSSPDSGCPVTLWEEKILL